eukprot:TRINITY_DN568_c0_g1_i1.p1 TRINITY_DN568_c0_g1~~TRINITY_DN568_c0_g1_i1.p1  ORF type:complete len:443 (-),score=126.23 TRINITY_DN568_c0_g1_i1:79-1407(-)
MKSVWGLLLLALLIVKGSEALIHDLTLDQDSRGIFKIESFGFGKAGKITLKLTDIKVNVGDKSSTDVFHYGEYGFHIRISSTEVYSLDKSNCQNLISGVETENEIKLSLHDELKDGEYVRNEEISTEGLYTIYFVTCPKEEYTNLKLSFKLHIEMFNVENGVNNYLSTGQSALPTIYFLLFATHLVLCGVWGRVIKRNWPTVNKLHLLMTALLVIKTLTMLWQSLEVRQMKVAGSSGGWGVVYYIFSFLRGMMLFTVILLIGTGWAFLKPFLNDREKKVFMFVIPLQLFANIALIIVGESSPGSQEWVTWKDIFALVDLICCAAIIIPIMWSIKHLRQAAQSDGKAAKSLKMLQLFRSFYLMVIAYIYFSRIIVTLLEPVIPYTAAWVAPFLNEIAAVVLYFTTGYWFRPGEDNPYFKLATSEEEEVAAVALEKMETADLDD